PRSVIALEIWSALSKLEKIRGPRIFATFFIRVNNGAFLLSSTPRACCACMMLTKSFFTSGK
ncbi:hypothetical protein D039_1148B, partial [Vibrio parahaemolyticus EKP-028]